MIFGMDPYSHSFFSTPPCKASDLGVPLPDDPHAVSVCLPTWKDVIAYKQKDPKLIKKLKNNFPGYGFQPAVQKLFAEAKKRFAKKKEECMVFPSEKVAIRFQEFLKEKLEQKSSLHDMRKNNVFAVCFPKEYLQEAEKYWWYTREIISSRLAQSTLNKEPLSDQAREEGRKAKKLLQARISEISGEPAQNIVLFPTGMSALLPFIGFCKYHFQNEKVFTLDLRPITPCKCKGNLEMVFIFLNKEMKVTWKKLKNSLPKKKC